MTSTKFEARYANKKYFFLVQRLAFLTGIGFWPGSSFQAWQITFATFNALEILFYAIFQSNYCINNSGNLVLFLGGLTPLITQAVTAVKILLVLRKRHELKRVLDILLGASNLGKN